MPLQKLQFRPGVNREGTNYSNEGGWYECDKIRFRSGYPEKIGGWTQATPGQTYLGVCRSMVNWVDLNNYNLIGLGTHLKYYVNSGLGVYHDVTPVRATATGLNNPFATVTGSQTVTVTDAANGAEEGDFVTFSGATGFNGVLASFFNAEFQITKIVDGNTYEIELQSTVTPTGTGSGGGAAVDAEYQIAVGLPAHTVGNGYGSGVWNGANIASFNTTLTYTSGTTPWVLLNAISTTINVTDTSQFPAAGTLIIDDELITYSGKTSTSFTGCTRGVIQDYTPASSTLSAGINASDTSIPLTSVTGFPVPTNGGSAIIRIGNEVIVYTGISGSSLVGCVRGTSGTTAASHLITDTVTEYFGFVHGYRPTAGTPAPVYVYQVLGYLGTTGWGDASATGSGVGQQMRLWSNDNFGKDLIFAERGGPIYYWNDNTSTWPRAVDLVTDVPIVATNQVMVSDVSRFVIAMGCNQFGSGTFNPMVVRWSDQEDPNTWTPAVTNQSGEQLLSNGSYIVQAKKNRQEILIWTDSAIYSMQYLGPPYVWGFQLLMDNISTMGPNAAIVVNNVAYWMGTDKFYSYSGNVQTLPCALRQYIFDDISFDQRYQTIAGTNEGYNEVWWYYVSQSEVNAAASENRVPLIDRYVIYNHLERIWYYGSLSRTFWLDSGLQQYPMAAYGDVTGGTLLFHENGNDDASTATPVPFDCFIGSSDFDIGDGHNFGYVWRIIPDINFTGSTNGYPQAYMQVSPRNFSGSAYTKSDITDTVSAQRYYPNLKQYTIQQYTPQVYSRIRGRQMSFRIGSGGQLGVAWQLGSPRLDVKPDGRR